MGRWGIIPARAGFTPPAPTPARRSRDHPRSRGVYPRIPCHRLGGPDHPRSRGVYWSTPSSSSATGGSSPLARGLLGAVIGVEILVRIIPARAGFTRSSSSPRVPATDHPRSRGVYSIRLQASSMNIGSSPLARGLLGELRDNVPVVGIIPARAGFTRPRLHRPQRGRDHPRSRGVYGPPPNMGV